MICSLCETGEMEKCNCEDKMVTQCDSCGQDSICYYCAGYMGDYERVEE